MATFEVLIYPIKLEPHPNADVIELAVIGGYRSIVQKGTLSDGDLIAYIPEGSIVPDWILERMNLVGKLAGKQHNRVKSIRLRGIVSQGLCFPLEYRINVVDSNLGIKQNHWVLVLSEIGAGITASIGDDVTIALGITKYIPKIPTCMGGTIFNAFGCVPKYDVENLKKWPDVLQLDESVVVTEKIHGNFVCFGYHPDINHPIVASRGLCDRGLAFKIFDNENANNLYVKMLRATIDDDGDDVITKYRRLSPTITPFYILGEVYGQGVQDLTYASEQTFRVFDIYVGQYGSGHFVDYAEMVQICDELGIKTVPLLYQGKFSMDMVNLYTSGNESVSGTGSCIREGIVIKPTTERRDLALGRVMLKNISDAYLVRSGKTTEFN